MVRERTGVVSLHTFIHWERSHSRDDPALSIHSPRTKRHSMPIYFHKWKLTVFYSIRTLSMASIHKTVLLSKNVLAVTTKTMGQVLEECGRCGFGAWILYVAAYTNARSVDGTKIFRLSQHIDRLCLSCLFFLILSHLCFNVIPRGAEESTYHQGGGSQLRR